MSSSSADRFAYQYQHEHTNKRSFGSVFRAMFCCGSQDDEDDSVRSMKLQISGPTDFRREEINIPGMTPSQERFVREKALSDAKKMFEHLQPLNSSPSQQFAQRPEPVRISYEQFTTPHAAPSPKQHSPGWETLKAHGRKISDSFKLSVGGGGGEERRPSWKGMEREDDSAVEMRGLVQGQVAGGAAGPRVGKTSEESWESDSVEAGVVRS